MLIKKSGNRRTAMMPPALKAFCQRIESCPAPALHTLINPLQEWPFPKTDLYHWINVLNRFDTLLSEANKQYGFNKGRSHEGRRAGQRSVVSEQDKALLVAILKFTRLLLENSANRNIYASYEHLSDLLVCGDLDIVENILRLLFRPTQRLNGQRSFRSSFNVAVDRILTLASTWPTSGFSTPQEIAKLTSEKADSDFPHHKATFSHTFYNQHVITGKGEKEKPESSQRYPEGMVTLSIGPESVRAAPPSNGGGGHVDTIRLADLEAQGVSLMASLGCYFHIPGAPKGSVSDGTSAQGVAAEQGQSGSTPEAPAGDSTPIDDRNAAALNGALQDLVPRAADPSQKDHAFAIQHKVNLARWLTSGWKIRRQLVAVRFLAISIYIFVTREDIANSKFFIHEPAFVNTLVEILHPDKHLPLDIQVASLAALEAISRYRSRLGEVLNQMNASVNHGVLNYILRKVVSGLEDEFSRPSMEFIDSLFSFLCYLITTQGGGSMLISAGVIPTLLQFLSVKTKHVKSVAKAVFTLDSLIYGFSNSFNSFLHANGLVTVTERIQRTVADLESLGKDESKMDVDECEQAVISKPLSLELRQLLKSLLRFVLHMMQNSGNSEGLRSLIDSTLPMSLGQIFQHSKICGPNNFATAAEVMATFIHNEPTSLAVLQECQLPQKYLDSIKLSIPESADAIAAIPHALGALCLNEAGIQLVKEMQAIPKLFGALTSIQHIKVLAEGDWARAVGDSIDELVRHHPSLRDLAVRCAFETLEDAETLADTKPREAGCSLLFFRELDADETMNELPPDGESDIHEYENGMQLLESPTTTGINKDGEITGNNWEVKNHVSIIQAIDVIARFMEGFLTNTSACKGFVQMGGLSRLLSIYSLRYIPFNFPSSPASFSLSRLFSTLRAADCISEVLEEILKELKRRLDEAEAVLDKVEAVGLSSFVSIRHADVRKRRDGQKVVDSLRSLHGIAGLLTDVYNPGTFVREREILEVVQCLSASLGEDLIRQLGRLHRCMLWEAVRLRSASCAALYNSPKPKKTLRKTLESWGAPQLDANISPRDGEKVEALPETDPALVNTKILKYFTTRIPKCIIPLLQGWSKLLQYSKITDQTLRKTLFKTAGHISSMIAEDLVFGKGLPESSEKYVFMANVNAILACFFLYDRFVTSMQLFPFLSFCQSGAFDRWLQLVSSMWEDLGKGEALNEGNKDLRESIEAAIQVAVTTWAYLATSKNVGQAYDNVSAVPRQRASLNIPAPWAFLVTIRYKLGHVIKEMWNGDFLFHAKNATVRSLLQAMVVIFRAEGELVPKTDGLLRESTRAAADENKVSHLVDMGLPRGAAVFALSRYSNDLSRAADYLFTHSDILARYQETAMDTSADGEAGAGAGNSSINDGTGNGTAIAAEGRPIGQTTSLDRSSGAPPPNPREGEQGEEGSERAIGAEPERASADLPTSESSDHAAADTRAKITGDSGSSQEGPGKSDLDALRKSIRETLSARGLALLKQTKDLPLGIYELLSCSGVSVTEVTDRAISIFLSDIGDKDVDAQCSTALSKLTHLFCDDEKNETALKEAINWINPLLDQLGKLLTALGSPQDKESFERSQEYFRGILFVLEPVLFFISEPDPVAQHRVEGFEIVEQKLEAGESNEDKHRLQQALSRQKLASMLKAMVSLLRREDEAWRLEHLTIESVVRILSYLTKDPELAVAFVHLGGLHGLLNVVPVLTSSVEDQPLILFVIRHCLETPALLRACMTQEVEESINPQLRRARWSPNDFLQNNAALVSRDFGAFISVVTESLTIPYDGVIDGSPYILPKGKDVDDNTLALSGLAKKLMTPESTATDNEACADDKETEPTDVKTQGESFIDTVFDSLQSMHKAVIGYLAATLMSLPNTKDLGKVKKGADVDKCTTDGTHDPALNDHIKRCFILQTFTEIVSSYHSCRMNLVFFNRSGKSRQNTSCGYNAKLIKSVIINYLINEVLPCEGVVSRDNPDIPTRKRLNESHWAELLLAALCSPSQDFSEKSGRRIQTELTFVRALVLDATHKALSSALSQSGKPLASLQRYGKMVTLLDLTTRILSDNKQRGYGVRDQTYKNDDFCAPIAEMMIEKSFVQLFTALIAEIELNHPLAKSLLGFVMKPLETLSKAAIRLGKTASQHCKDGEQSLEASSNLLDSSLYESGRPLENHLVSNDAEDVVRNSALGIIGGQHDEDIDEDEDSGGSELFNDNNPFDDTSDVSDYEQGEDEAVRHDDDLDMEILIRPQFPQQGRHEDDDAVDEDHDAVDDDDEEIDDLTSSDEDDEDEEMLDDLHQFDVSVSDLNQSSFDPNGFPVGGMRQDENSEEEDVHELDFEDNEVVSTPNDDWMTEDDAEQDDDIHGGEDDEGSDIEGQEADTEEYPEGRDSLRDGDDEAESDEDELEDAIDELQVNAERLMGHDDGYEHGYFLEPTGGGIGIGVGIGQEHHFPPRNARAFRIGGRQRRRDPFLGIGERVGGEFVLANILGGTNHRTRPVVAGLLSLRSRMNRVNNNLSTTIQLPARQVNGRGPAEQIPQNAFAELLGDGALQVLETFLSRRPGTSGPATYRIEVNNAPWIFSPLTGEGLGTGSGLDTTTRITITNSPIHSIHDFQSMSTAERWRQEATMLRRSGNAYRQAESHLINALIPGSIERERENRKRKEDLKRRRDKQTAERSLKTSEPSTNTSRVDMLTAETQQTDQVSEPATGPPEPTTRPRGDESSSLGVPTTTEAVRAGLSAAERPSGTSTTTPDEMPIQARDIEMMDGPQAREGEVSLTVPQDRGSIPANHSSRPDPVQSESPAMQAPTSPVESVQASGAASDQVGASSAEAGEGSSQQNPNRVTTVTIQGRVIDLSDTDIDPTVLSALPAEMIPQVVEDHLRERGQLGQHPAGNVDTATLSEFLNVLPEGERAGLFSQDDRLRMGGQGLAGSELDAASFIATLDPSFRRQILAEFDESVLANLPPALVAEANAIQQRAGQTRRALRSRPAAPRTPEASRGVPSSTQPKKAPSRKDALNIVDQNGLTQLVRLIFTPDVISMNVLHRLMLNLCENSRTRFDLNNLLVSLLVEAVESDQISVPIRTSLKGKGPAKPKALSGNLQNLLASIPTTNDAQAVVAHRTLETLLVLNNEHPASFFFNNEALGARRSSAKRRHGCSSVVALLLSLLDKKLIKTSGALSESIMQLLAIILRPLEKLGKQHGHTSKTSERSNEPGESSTPEQKSVPVGGNQKSETAASHKEQPANKVPDISESALKNITDLLASGNCAGRTFQYTLTVLQHLSCVVPFRNIILEDLVRRLQSVAETIVDDLAELGKVLDAAEHAADLHGHTLELFTSQGSHQAKLLRLLKTLDYLVTKASPALDQKSGFPHEIDTETIETSGSRGVETSRIKETPQVDVAVKVSSDESMVQKVLKDAYRHEVLKSLWQQLGKSLRIVFEKKDDMTNVAKVLLPLIEGYMVVSKRLNWKGLPASPGSGQISSQVGGVGQEAESFLSFTTQHKRILNTLVRDNPSLLSGSFAVLVNNPNVLEFDNKRNYFNQQLHKRSHRNHNQTLPLNLRRQYVFEDSFYQLQGRTGDELKYGKINVRFFHEEGMDAGGLTREWFSVLAREIFNPNYALFKSAAVDSVTYQPNRSSWVNPDHLFYFKFVGRFIGKAIFDGRLLDCYFTRSFYKHILGRKVDVKDLEAIDPEYHKSLEWILNNDITDVMDLNFSMETDDFGKKKVIELKPHGDKIVVTEENKREYVSLIVEQKLTTAIKEQIKAFLTGFHEIIPQSLVRIFDEQELELLISGVPDIDIDDWKNNTEYVGYSSGSRQIQWFWRVVRGMDQEERAKLLQFITGTSKVPLEGFAVLHGASGPQKFQIHKDYGPTNRLPSAHTCFNQLDLPLYESYEALRNLLMIAIHECTTGFGLV